VKLLTNEKFDLLNISRVILVSVAFAFTMILGITSHFYNKSINSGGNILVNSKYSDPERQNETIEKSIANNIIMAPKYFNPIIRVDIGEKFWTIDTEELRRVSINIYIQQQKKTETILEKMAQKIYYIDKGKIVFIFPTNSNMRPMEMTLPMHYIIDNIKKR